MDQGLISNPKDLERMQHEMVSLERRITTLEDDELEVMERLEDAQRDPRRADRPARRRPTRGSPSSTRGARRPAAPRSTPSSPSSTAERGPIAAELPDDLLALYERLRAQKGGVGAAALRAAALQRLPARPRRRRARRDRGPPPTTRCIRCEECQPDPGPHRRVGPVTERDQPPSVVIEADGGSRGNPGPAAYGAVLKDADTGEVIAERAAARSGSPPTTSRSTAA